MSSSLYTKMTMLGLEIQLAKSHREVHVSCYVDKQCLVLDTQSDSNL